MYSVVAHILLQRPAYLFSLQIDHGARACVALDGDSSAIRVEQELRGGSRDGQHLPGARPVTELVRERAWKEKGFAIIM